MYSHVSEELCCPVCREIFKSPVRLSCSHSFCRECLQQFWKTNEAKECPVCKRRCSNDLLPPNLTLEKLCQSFLKEREARRSSGLEYICSLHNKKFKLFCIQDNQPVCVVCRDSQKHTNHTFRSISETGPSFKNNSDLIRKSTLNECPVQHRLQGTDNTNQSEAYRKIIAGERDRNKPHKTILMVGETGSGKTTLINVMINYMLGVQREDKVWFEITDDQSDRTSAHTQTSSITVYGFYQKESPIHLTIIDTPGYGDTRGVENDKEIAESLLILSESEEGIHEVDAVCLVIKSTQNRLSDRQIYIFDAVQCLFGRDIDENIVLLFTRSSGAPPKDALMAVKEAKVKCAVNDKNQPVYFLFNNCQSEPADEEYETIQKQSWDLSHSGMMGFFKFIEIMKPKSLKMTRDVLQRRKQLEANLNNLQSRVHVMELKQNELKQTQEALEKNKKAAEENKDFESEVEVKYKERVDIDPSVAKAAMCCPVCEENCHYPGCWSFTPLSRCSVMKDEHCTVCTNKCHYSKHVKEAKIYETKTKNEKRTNEELKKKYDDNMKKIRDGVSLVQNLEEELQELEKEKIKLVMEAFHCVETLQMISLNTDSLITLQHIDYLIEKLKEINEPEKVETLENIKKRAGEEKLGALGYIKRFN